MGEAMSAARGAALSAAAEKASATANRTFAAAEKASAVPNQPLAALTKDSGVPVGRACARPRAVAAKSVPARVRCVGCVHFKKLATWGGPRAYRCCHYLLDTGTPRMPLSPAACYRHAGTPYRLAGEADAWL